MSFGQIVELIILWSIAIVFGRFTSIFLYRFFSFILFRIIIGGGCILFLISSIKNHYKSEVIITTLLIASEYIKNLYLYQKDFKYNILDTFKYLLGITVQAGKGIVSIPTGIKSEKEKLKQERADFENEKEWLKAERERQDKEWENIKKAWDELIRERENSEKGKGNYQQSSSHQNNQSYNQAKSKSEQSQKQSTGRYFKEFAEFDLKDFSKNDAYKVLGCKRGDDKTTLKSAWKKLQMKYHPDRVDKSWSLEQVEEGKSISQLINWAKDELGL